ncbi:hypothetical protein ACC755_37335, partial [Rhizobium ruizarguesonis]
MPKESAPANVDHGKNYFLIVPAEKGGGNEPEAILGYALKTDSTVLVSIGDKTFKMFVKDKAAWVSEAALEPDLFEGDASVR